MSAPKYSPVPGSAVDKLLAILADGVERSCRDLVAASGCEPSRVYGSLVGAVNRGVLVKRKRAHGVTWQTADAAQAPQHQPSDGPQIWNAWLLGPQAGPAQPTPDETVISEPPCFALTKDGRLTIRCAGFAGELAPRETDALVRYLIDALPKAESPGDER